MQVYQRYHDPGHSWLRVRLVELITLGISAEISAYSYQRGKWAYLEEDCDMDVFVRACQAREHKITIKNHVTNKSSRIRTFQSYNRFNTLSP